MRSASGRRAARGKRSFTARALDLIYQFSEGVPRKINLICDRSLETGFAALSPTVDETLVAKAAEALELTRAGGGAIGSSRLRPGPRAGRFGVAPGTRRWLATAAGVVAGVGLGAALALMVPWSQRAGPDVAPFLATLPLAQPVDFAAGAAPGGPQSFAIRTVEFATLEPAEATAAMLRELGADAAVTPPDGEVLSYIVWIGSYESLADARKMETVVRRRFGFVDARIVAGALPSGSPP